MNRLKTIGVIGGMGPQATVLLQQRIIDAVQADDDASHVPLLIDMNPQIPSRLDYLLENKGADPGLVLTEMARRLEAAGAEALAMPCNTAHYFAPQISQAVGIPLLHMVDAAAQRVADLFDNQGGRLGVLASPATDDIKLFHNAFKPYGVEVVFSTQRDAMLSAIRSIKAKGVSQKSIRALNEGALNCIQQGAQCLLVGCSEFSLIKEKIATDMSVLDTVDVLVEDIVQFSGVKQAR